MIAYSIILIFHVVNATIYLRLDSNPAVFGSTVNLVCFINNPPKNVEDCKVHQWTIGANEAVLVYKGVSYNIAKYTETLNHSCHYLTLSIGNFSLSDINRMYTFSCGFESATYYLKLQEDIFVYYPKHKSFNTSIKNSLVVIQANLDRVYPLPNCSLHLNDKIQTIIVSNSTKNGLLYDVIYTGTYNVSDFDCDKIPVVICKLHADLDPIQITGGITRNCTVRIVDKVASNEQYETTTVRTEDSRHISIFGFLILVMITCLLVVSVSLLMIKYFRLLRRRSIQTPVDADGVMPLNSIVI